MLAGKNIVLLVGGSIAAYKSAEIVRELVRRQAQVRVVMSEAALRFITPLTLQTLSRNPVTTDMFDEAQEGAISHIELADSADVVLAAPATANFIAKLAAGLADDPPSCIVLATRAPVVLAPAMNVHMWENPLTQRNTALLSERGMHIVCPAEGELACGYAGRGRLAEIDDILDGLDYATTAKDLVGCRVVVSAGPTREALDPVRFVSNRSSGKMGFALARMAYFRGAEVELVSGPTSLCPPKGIGYHPVLSAEEMRNRIIELVNRPSSGFPAENSSQYVFMAAAVTDHRPEQASDVKLKLDKNRSYSIEMAPCPHILTELGETRESIESRSGRELKIIGFSAETGDEEQLLAWSREKLKARKVDMIVANFAADSFEKDTNRVWLLPAFGREEEVSTADKFRVAAKIISSAKCL